MTPEQLSDAIVAVLADLVDEGRLSMPTGVPSTVRIERPKVKEHGDYATNIALQVAKPAGLVPRELAAELAARLTGTSGIAAAEVAGPGFLNLRIEAAAQGKVAAEVVSAGPAYGGSELLTGSRINLEYVSVNPTGPVHLAHARWAVAGDSLARILELVGAGVTREYYFNDHGAQVDRFARSLLARAHGREVPADGYAGSYLEDIVARVVAVEPGVLDLSDEAAQEVFRRVGVDLMFDAIKAELHAFGVNFDVFFHEASLHASGAVDRAVARLEELGNIYQAEGAVWLRSSDFGDDKDRVVIKSDGKPAYIAADLAYYLDKRERGFDLVVIILGADHHGYVGRMLAMCAAFGDKPHENLELVIGQMVNLLRDGVPLRMSKRAGTIVTMADLVDVVGVDAARYALVRYSSDSPIDIDLELWTRQSNDNPVFYVQYAHARLASILRNAVDLGIQPAGDDFDPSLLAHPREGDLLRALAELPRVVGQAATMREPHRVARYLEETAGTFHRFYDECRVLPQGDEEPTDLHRARLLLVAATRQVVANGLRLLGVSAPERM